jgi:hypothetical protein
MFSLRVVMGTKGQILRTLSGFGNGISYTPYTEDMFVHVMAVDYVYQ